ncbi:TetR family transcriptional regulator C-terminal domain-containing protein [Micromonospora sp. AMSO31t]|uniref:TetR family transcriptional regulator C-terminal domain-containing protein n=1 Tax=Micromonospora sp. AMSO31t TaxID=2650566 RepID=UPI001CEDBEE1|nr:TetR family transcriptional regulator C-terminal domain-containing protein [Micromonospora sp. AMSO31t]
MQLPLQTLAADTGTSPAADADPICTAAASHRRSGGVLRSAADFYALSGRPFEDGCSLGSLASEIVKTDLDVHDRLAEVFAQWREIFRVGLDRMRQLGRIDASADPARLADMFLAAYQGGMLLSQVARDIGPLQDALSAAVDHLRTFVTSDDQHIE